MHRPPIRDLLLALGVPTLGALTILTVALAAPLTQEAEHRTYLPIALDRVPVAGQTGVTSGTDWRKWSFTPTSETIIGTVAASPNSDRLSGVIAFFNGGTGSLDQAAVQVRFKPDGEIDALDGTTYRAVRKLRYEMGKVYEFRVIVNVPQQSFDAYVTPADEAPVLVARDFAFNPTAAPSDQVSHMGIYSATGSFQVLQFAKEYHTAYERLTPKTAYGWFPGTPNADAVVNVSPTLGDGWYGTADIHPDGTDMIFHGAAWGYARIWRYAFATKKITPLTPPTFVAVEPAYSADGDSIVFTSDKDLGTPRFDMFEVGRTRPDADGFKGGYTSVANLYVMDADGRNLRQITFGNSDVDKRGSFSPDGETVVFLSSRGRERSICGRFLPMARCRPPRWKWSITPGSGVLGIPWTVKGSTSSQGSSPGCMTRTADTPCVGSRWAEGLGARCPMILSVRAAMGQPLIRRASTCGIMPSMTICGVCTSFPWRVATRSGSCRRDSISYTSLTLRRHQTGMSPSTPGHL